MSNDSPIWADEQVDWYVQNWGEHPLFSELPHLLSLPCQADIIDLGCASGGLLAALCGYLAQGQLVGIDPSPRMLEYAKARTLAPNPKVTVEWRLGQAEHLPCADQSADWILALSSVQHWQDVHQGLRECQRVLRPGGTLLLVEDIWQELEMPEGVTPPADADEPALLPWPVLAQALEQVFASPYRRWRHQGQGYAMHFTLIQREPDHV